MDFQIKKRVSEIQPELNDLINTGGNLLIYAPTGAGKTYAIIKYAEMHPNKKILFVVPKRSLVNNIDKDYDWVVKNNTFDCTVSNESDNFRLFVAAKEVNTIDTYAETQSIIS